VNNGKWKIENGKWKIENGKWKIENLNMLSIGCAHSTGYGSLKNKFAFSGVRMHGPARWKADIKSGYFKFLQRSWT